MDDSNSGSLQTLLSSPWLARGQTRSVWCGPVSHIFSPCSDSDKNIYFCQLHRLWKPEQVPIKKSPIDTHNNNKRKRDSSEPWQNWHLLSDLWCFYLFHVAFHALLKKKRKKGTKLSCFSQLQGGSLWPNGLYLSPLVNQWDKRLAKQTPSPLKMWLKSIVQLSWICSKHYKQDLLFRDTKCTTSWLNTSSLMPQEHFWGGYNCSCFGTIPFFRCHLWVNMREEFRILEIIITPGSLFKSWAQHFSLFWISVKSSKPKNERDIYQE